eukprot:399737_1
MSSFKRLFKNCILFCFLFRHTECIEVAFLDILNVLRLPNHVWSLGPRMIHTRVDLGCFVMSDDYVYAIGGGRAENERISIHGVEKNQSQWSHYWQPIEPFTNATELSSHGIAPYEDVIWVFGGRAGKNPPVYFDQIWNIYTKDGSVALLTESLPSAFSLWTATMITVDNVVYMFGSQSMKYVIPVSSDPTKTPTDNPSYTSYNPTSDPTSAPSDDPTNPANISTSILPTSGMVVGTFESSISPTTMDITTSDTVLIIICIAALISFAIIILVCSKRKKKVVEQVRQMSNQVDINVANIIRDDMIDIKQEVQGDIMGMEYTVEGPNDNKCDVVKTYTDEKQRDTHIKQRVRDTSEQTIWNNDVQSVNALHCTPHLEPNHSKVYKNTMELEKWLEKEVGLPQYFDILIQNGYESMRIIEDISNGKELKEIGIESNAHQMIIIKEIEKWKNAKLESDIASDEFVIGEDDAIKGETMP